MNSFEVLFFQVLSNYVLQAWYESNPRTKASLQAMRWCYTNLAIDQFWLIDVQILDKKYLLRHVFLKGIAKLHATPTKPIHCL